MPEISHVDLINNTDFTKGFSSWHIRWPIQNSWLTKVIVSPNFDTPVKQENGTTTVYSWYLGVEMFKDTIWFGLGKNPSPVPQGVIFRMALCDGKKAPFFNKPLFRVFGETDELIFVAAAFTLEEAKPFVGDDLVLHAWLEIPIDISKNTPTSQALSHNSRLTKMCFLLKGGNDFLAEFSELIKGVLNEESKDPLSDVTLAIVDKDDNGGIQVQRQFFCHRNILAVRSPVFKTMFTNTQWKESANNNERVVEIDDIDAMTMERVLRYIYTGYLFPKYESSLKCQEYLDIINAGEKYMLPALKDFCAAHLINYAAADDSRLKQLVVADRCRLPQLKAVCMASLSSNPEGINIKALPPDLLTELHQAMAKRNIDTKEICLNGHQ